MPSPKVSLKYFTLLLKKKGSQTEPSLKIVVNRQIRKAVERNRVKRVAREFFRGQKELRDGVDVVCIARPSAGEVTNRELFQDLKKWAGADSRHPH